MVRSKVKAVKHPIQAFVFTVFIVVSDLAVVTYGYSLLGFIQHVQLIQIMQVLPPIVCRSVENQWISRWSSCLTNVSEAVASELSTHFRFFSALRFDFSRTSCFIKIEKYGDLCGTLVSIGFGSVCPGGQSSPVWYERSAFEECQSRVGQTCLLSFHGI